MENILTESPPTAHTLTPSQTCNLGDVVFHFGLFISQTNRRHPLPLILPHTLVRPWRGSDRQMEKRGLVSKHDAISCLFLQIDGSAKRQLLLRDVAMTTKKT